MIIAPYFFILFYLMHLASSCTVEITSLTKVEISDYCIRYSKWHQTYVASGQCLDSCDLPNANYVFLMMVYNTLYIPTLTSLVMTL